MSIGKQKPPISLEMLTGSLFLSNSSAFSVSIGYQYIYSGMSGIQSDTSGALARVLLVLQ